METATVYIDGYCVLCNRFLKQLIRLDRKKQLSFKMLQSDEGRDLIQTFYPSGNVPDSVLLYSGGKVLIKSDAVLEAFRILKRYDIAVKVLSFIPLGWRNWIYDFVASNRYSWFGRYENCQLPSAGIFNELHSGK